jgi:putative ABC transport system substrate-binding protein
MALVITASIHRAWARKPGTVPSVGVLVTHAPVSDPVLVALREGFRNLGYEEGRDITLIITTAEGQLERLPGLAASLVSRNVDVIVAPNELSVRTALKATSAVPIVMVGWGYDPVALGLVESFNKPGGTITGLYWLPSELEGKRLEMLKEVLPSISRVAVFWDSFGKASLASLKRAANSLDLQLIPIEVRTIEDLSAAIKEAKRNKAHAGIFVWAPAFYVHRNRVAQLTTEAKLPTIHAIMQVVEAGGLLSYGPDGYDSFRRVAYYVDRILKGAKPADLPIEQLSELRLAVNLRTAKAMDLTIPESILIRADKVIR